MSWKRTTDGFPPEETGVAKVTILVDNRAGEGLLAEHGLSLWIEAGGMRVLFDTGQSALDFNARVLGVDTGSADALVLSHGHYDHTGGIPAVLHEARNLPVYVQPGVTKPRYAIRGETAKAIGMPREASASLDKHPRENLHRIRGTVMLADGIGLTGPIPRVTAFEDTGGPFYLDPEGKLPDPIEDDLALWFRMKDGLVVCAGCSHAGIVNTLEYVRGLADGLPVRAVIGGFHLGEASRERLDRTMDALRMLAPEIIVPCHCTGAEAVEAMKRALGERVTPGAAGMVFRFDATCTEGGSEP